MPRHGAVVFGDIDGKLDVLHVACKKCDRRGQYPVARLIERYGREAKLVDWKDTITADCPRRTNARIVRFRAADQVGSTCLGRRRRCRAPTTACAGCNAATEVLLNSCDMLI
jgi:hypothetical protein